MITPQELLNDYIAEINRKGMHFRAVKYDVQVFLRYIERENLNLFQITIRNAQEFQEHLTTLEDEDGGAHYSRGSVLTMMGRITSFYDYVRHRKLAPANPFTEVRKVKIEKRLPRNILNEEEMGKLLNYLRNFNRGMDLTWRKSYYKAHVVAELLYSTGARAGEIAKITRNDIDFVRGVVKVLDSKTSRVREVMLGSFAEKVLKIYLDEFHEHITSGSAAVFGGKNNLIPWLNKVLAEACSVLKFAPVTSHSFRHAVGSHLLKRGCDIRYIQEILGHKRITTTQIYTRVNKEELKSKLDEFHPRKFHIDESKADNDEPLPLPAHDDADMDAVIDNNQALSSTHTVKAADAEL